MKIEIIMIILLALEIGGSVIDMDSVMFLAFGGLMLLFFNEALVYTLNKNKHGK